MNAHEIWELPTRHLGRRVLVFDSLGSTNDRATELASDSGNDGVVVLAREQKTGRGQHGRRWQCSRGDGVLMSVLLFPPPHLRRPVVLAAWVAVAVCRTVQRLTGLEPRIKWPNDVLLQERKVCGILVEQGKGTVAGIGLNVNQSAAAFAADGLPDAASLASLSGAAFDVDAVARLLIADLDCAYDKLINGRLADLEDEWRQRLDIVGKAIEVECSEGAYRGVLYSLSFNDVQLETRSGEIVHMSPERVRHFRAW